MESHDKACWPYLKSNDAKHPVMGLLIRAPLKTLPITESLFRIDTGYEGFLLLSEERYRRMGFHLSELPRRCWPEAETVTGEVFRLRRALTIIEIPKIDVKLEGYVDTFQGNLEDLIGLELINNLKLILNGSSETTCVVR